MGKVNSKIILVSCPLCDEAKAFLPVKIPSGDQHIETYGDLYEGVKESEWKVCGSCGFVHQNPRPSKQALNDFYLQSKYHKRHEPDLKILTKEYKNAYRPDIGFLKETLPSLFAKKGRVLDVGCGYGFALHELSQEGLEPVGIEPDEVRAEFAKTALNLPNIQRGIMTTDTRFDKKVDLIFSHHAFEHIADFDDVFAGLENVVEMGGYFFASVPTYRDNRSVMSKVYLNSGHYSSFSHKSFARLLAKHGYEYVAHRYYNGIGLRLTDDLLIIAKKVSSSPIDDSKFAEQPVEVQRYVNVVNPMRALAFLPAYALVYKRTLQFGRRLIYRTKYLKDPVLLKEKIKNKFLS